MKESILNQLVQCPVCGSRYRPGIDGNPEGTACFKCEDLPKKDDDESQIEMQFD